MTIILTIFKGTEQFNIIIKMKLKGLKNFDQFATPPKLLIARGSEERGKEYSDNFGSWIGFILSSMALFFCLFYLKYLIDEMHSYNKDTYKTSVQTNRFDDTTNSF